MSSKTSPQKCLIMVLAFVIATGGNANADFTFGTPTNLGPIVNSPTLDGAPSITADGLSLFFNSQRSGGYGHYDVWMVTRQTTNDSWGEPVNPGPTINTASLDGNTAISPDGLTLHFTSNRPGGYGDWDIYVTTRATVLDPWGAPVNIGPPFNTSASDHGVSTSADALSLFFGSDRPGGLGNGDLYVSTRAMSDDPWGEPVNLGPVVNSPFVDGSAMISPDGLSLFFHSNRPGGYGGFDAWVTMRATKDDDWGTPVNLGPTVNTSAFDGAATVSADGSTLYFMSGRPGGVGSHDLWEAPILPIVDFNGDEVVDSADMCIMVDHWGEDYSLCDIGPMPWGDGTVDVQDLIVLAEHLFEDYRLIAHWQLDETDGEIAYDSIGVCDGVLNGVPTWQPAGGKIDGALQFDGIDDYVGTPFVLDPWDGPFSVFAWIKGGAPGQVIVSQTDGSRPGYRWLGADPSHGGLTSWLMHPPLPPLVSESAITDGDWHHIGLVYDRIALHRHLYVDGAEVAKDTSPVGGLHSDGGLYFGANKDLSAASFFSGLIDDVRIYDRAIEP